MKYTIVGKNMEVTERLSNQVMKKLDKLDKYFAEDVEAQVTLSTVKDSKKVEVTIPTKGQLIRAEQTTGDMYASIDAVEEAIERQLRKYKTKMLSKKKGAKDAFNEAFLDAEPEPVLPLADPDVVLVQAFFFHVRGLHQNVFLPCLRLCLS